MTESESARVSAEQISLSGSSFPISGASVKEAAPPPGAPLAEVGQWSAATAWPLIAIHSALTPEGKVLTYGTTRGGEQTGKFIYDVWESGGGTATGHLTLPNETGTDLFCSAQLMLPGGQMLLTGGDLYLNGATTNRGNSDVNLFNTTTNEITRAGSMARGRWYATTTLLPNSDVYIQGGRDGEDVPELRTANGQFVTLSGINTSLLNWWYPRNIVGPDGLIAGLDVDGRIYRVNPYAAGSLEFLGYLEAGNTGHGSSAALFRPGLLLQGGANSPEMLVIDVNTPIPTITPAGSLTARRQWLNLTVLADGRVLATGGSEKDSQALPTDPIASFGISRAAEIWDPSTRKWSVGAVAAKPRLYHSTALLLPDARVLVGGGGAPGPVLGLDAEIYSPPYLFSGNGLAARAVISSAPLTASRGQEVPLTVQSSEPIARIVLAKTGSVTHSFDMEQRFMELKWRRGAGDQFFAAIPASVADVPPGYYMVFAIDEKGVPSVAKILRLFSQADDRLIKPWTLLHVGTLASAKVSTQCPRGQVLVGATGRAGSAIDRLAPLCIFSDDAGQWLGDPSAGRVIGGTGGGAFAKQCPRNTAVSGMSANVGETVHQVTLECSPLSGTQTVSPGSQLVVAGGGAFGTTRPAERCTSGFAASGLYGEAGSFVTSIGLLCARGLTETRTSTPSTSTESVGGDGGTPYAANCPANSYVVGFSGGAGNWIDRLQAECATFGADGRWSQILTGPPPVGGSGGAAFSRLCPASMLVSGLTGSAGRYVDAIEVVCASPVDSTTATLARAGAGLSEASASFGGLSCPAGSFVSGTYGNSSVYLDSLALTCSPFSAASTLHVAGNAELVKAPSSCQRGEWLVGIAGGAGAWLDSVAPLCASVNELWARTSPPRTGTRIGGPTGAPYSLTCPDRSIVSGLEAQAGAYVDKLSLLCTAPDGSSVATSGSAGAGLSEGSLSVGRVTCPAGTVAIGLPGAGTAYVDAIGIQCQAFGQSSQSPSAGVPVGTPYQLTCPAGYLMAGISGGSGSWLDSANPLCVSIDALGQWTSVPAPNGAGAGGPGGGAYSLRCPTNHAVSGLRGSAGRYVDRIGVACAPTTSAGPALEPAAFAGLGLSEGTADFGALNCPAGTISLGIAGYAVDFVNSLALRCTTR